MKLGQTFMLLAVLVATLAAGPAAPPGAADVADVPAADLRAAGDPTQRYFLVGPGEGVEAPEDGFGLLVVLPGGDGGPDFLTFLKRVHKNALGDRYLLAHLVAVQWTEEQRIVWPTAKARVEGQEFTTEEFVAAVVQDVSRKHKVNPARVFRLGWSSGGPPTYAAALSEGTPVKGASVAMSVFKPHQLPSLKTARDRPFWLYHSPEDKVCPIGMARAARIMLEQNGAKVRLIEYEGGHGWRGNVYGDLRQGLKWLESSGAAESAQAPAADQPAAPVAAGDANLLFSDGLEQGQDAPNNWSRGASINGVEYIWDAQVAHGGSHSLCLRKTAQRFFPIASWNRQVTHQQGQHRLEVALWVKASRASKAVVDVQFLDAQGQWISHKWAAYIGAKNAGDPPADHDWRQYAGTVEVPPGTVSLNIAPQIYGPGTVWFDDITAAYVR